MGVKRYLPSLGLMVGWSIPFRCWGRFVFFCSARCVSTRFTIYVTPPMDFSNWDLLVFVSMGVDDSCFNAFSRVDMRVEVKIPGGVKLQVIDERGNKLTPSQERAYGR